MNNRIWVLSAITIVMAFLAVVVGVIWAIVTSDWEGPWKVVGVAALALVAGVAAMIIVEA